MELAKPILQDTESEFTAAVLAAAHLEQLVGAKVTELVTYLLELLVGEGHAIQILHGLFSLGDWLDGQGPAPEARGFMNEVDPVGVHDDGIHRGHDGGE